ncbi:hypothetical protein [Xanthomonas indica]|uniref:Cytochrome c family protein n=1 Tax=Xanthomonas indica TaxID=2912242 RepID=A0AAU8I484_9XANT|nr:hypothetical protein [Xanthomonas indica]MCI2261396.1 hypothetical protein [Xanthomonas indica]
MNPGSGPKPGSGVGTPTPGPGPAPSAAACAPPAAPAPSWFPHAQTPAPDSAGFQSSSNCAFHQWSWNAFLWLTQDVGGQPRFLTMPSDGIGGVADGVLDPLIGRSQQARTVELIDQAGPDGVLVDRHGRAVYYSIHSNDVFGQFMASNHLQDPKALRAFDPKTPFPVGSMTLKAAWKVVQPGEDVSTFYTRQATIAKLGMRKGKLVATSDTETQTVALVGFHIGGTVNGHPEMIWATFEHQDNAPDLPKPAEEMLPNDVVSAKDWTFYQAGTPMKQCNVNAAGAGALTLNAQTQTLSPVTQVCRMVPFGGQKPCPSGQDCNIANIQSINASVQGQLNDVWKNYFEVGAIWFVAEDALAPNCTFQPGSALECIPTPTPAGAPPLLTGSIKLSNSTIETFTQVQSTQNNCFACHNTTQVISPDPRAQSLPGLNVNISHVVINDYFQAQLPQKAPPAVRPATPR